MGLSEEYDLDLTKLSNRSVIKLKKLTIQWNFIEKGIFDWDPKQELSFRIIKNVMTNKAVVITDLHYQFYLLANIL